MIVDCAVHPVLADDEFGERIGRPWNLARVPTLFGDQYTPAFDQLVEPIVSSSDPGFVAKRLLVEREVDFAVLSPSTRGYFPNPQLAIAVAHAANTVLSDRWLDCPEADGRFLGSIRVALNDPDAAVREIRDWAADPRFVQVVVPLRGMSPLGDERFFPIWREAAEHGLPVFVHDDLATLVELLPTPVGYPRYYAEYHALRPFTAVVHLSSLITSGVFERLPDLRFVFGDCGITFARPLIWRLDKDWRSGRLEVPWVSALPTSYLPAHARFVTQPEEIADAGATIGEPLAPFAVFGSRYPYWDGEGDTSGLAGLGEAASEAVLAGNAREFYPRIQVRTAAIA